MQHADDVVALRLALPAVRARLALGAAATSWLCEGSLDDIKTNVLPRLRRARDELSEASINNRTPSLYNANKVA